MGRVAGKVAFITGAGQGQGRSHAVRLAEEGADIIATDICRPYPDRVHYGAADEAALEETRALVEKTGQRCVTAIADVRDRAALQAAVDLGVSELGKIDTVLANAGVITFHERSLDIGEDVYDLVVDTNVKGVWNTIQVTAPELVKAGGGAVVITSSAAGLRGQMHYAHYVASKHAVVGLAKAFANELAPHRIRVNTIHPTGVSSVGMGSDTGVLDLAIANPGTFMMNAMNMLPDLDQPPGEQHQPVPVLGVGEISNAVLFLVSDEGRYITGASLPVDAGNTNKP